MEPMAGTKIVQVNLYNAKDTSAIIVRLISKDGLGIDFLKTCVCTGANPWSAMKNYTDNFGLLLLKTKNLRNSYIRSNILMFSGGIHKCF